MPSGQEQNQSTVQSISHTSIPAQPGNNQVNQSMIRQSLGNRSPLAAIQEMRAANASQSEINPQAVADVTKERREIERQTKTIETPPVVERPISSETIPPGEAKDPFEISLDSPPIDEAPVEALSIPDDGLETPDVPAAENFKKLRAKAREAIASKKELEENVTKLSTELEEYKTGKIVPDVLVENQNRIAQLEKYEKIVNLKNSREYTEKFIKPLNILQTKVTEIANDYGVPEEVMHQALTLTNRAELNGFLSQHFDELGGLEVKEAITQMQGIKQQADAAEAEPAKAMMNMQDEFRTISVQRDQARKTVIASTSKDAWGKAIDRIRSEGKATELIYKPNDSTHNENFVVPVLKAASQEYGKIMRMLAEGGLEALDPELAEALGRTVLLAHASAVSIESRNAALRHASQVEETNNRRNAYNRVALGSGRSSGSGGAPSNPARTTPQEASKILANKVLAGRGK